MSTTTATPTTAPKKAPSKDSPRRPSASQPSAPRSPLPPLTPNASPQRTVAELRASLSKVISELEEFTGTAPEAAKVTAKALAIVRSLETIDRKVKENDPDLQLVTAKQLKGVKDLAQKLFNDFDETYRILHEDVAELKGVTVGLTVATNNVNKRVDHTNTRVGKLEAAVRVHIGAILAGAGVAILIWIVASIIWSRFDHAPKAIKQADGTLIHQYNSLNDLWYVILFGFIIAGGFYFLYLLAVLIVSSLANPSAAHETEGPQLAAPTFPSDAPSQGTTGSTPTPTKPYNTADAGADGVRS